MKRLVKLLPKQEAKGDGNFQAGRVNGDLHSHQSTTNQTIYNIVVVNAEGASNEDGPVQEPADVQSPKLTPVSQSKKSYEATSAQRELLRFMATSPANEARAEAFMRREFETDRVKKLSDFECLRTTRYLETCMQRDAQRLA